MDCGRRRHRRTRLSNVGALAAAPNSVIHLTTIGSSRVLGMAAAFEAIARFQTQPTCGRSHGNCHQRDERQRGFAPPRLDLVRSSLLDAGSNVGSEGLFLINLGPGVGRAWRSCEPAMILAFPGKRRFSTEPTQSVGKGGFVYPTPQNLSLWLLCFREIIR